MTDGGGRTKLYPLSLKIMSRYISIDYGEKRIGVAVTDQLKMFVTPYTTIENRSEDWVFSELLKIFSEQRIERVIIGLPLNIEGEDTPKTTEVRVFFQKLTEKTNLPLILWDERYSTSEANEFLISKGINWQKSKEIVDQIAAAVILESYLRDLVISN